MPVPSPSRPARAWFAGGGGLLATGLAGVTHDPADLDGDGFHAVVVTFEGRLTAWRFDDVRHAPLPPAEASWPAQPLATWTSSLDEAAYRAGVDEVRRRVREGEVYQANLCRVLAAPRPQAGDPWALAARLARGNPAPYAAVLDVPGGDEGDDDDGAWLVSASPELFLRRDGDRLASGPIKGTGVTAADLTAKDEAENVMIVDLVRNDLQHVCVPGTVEVSALLAVEQHPGLVHLVSTVEGRLSPGTGWSQVLAATSPPGSVSGAPKSSALRAIGDLEPVPRGPYCGAVGWVDGRTRTACLAVGIRTFWWQGGLLRFGAGAGITWGSDAAAEWTETELKAGRLLALAAGEEHAWA